MPLDSRSNWLDHIRLALALAVIASHAPNMIDGDGRREPLLAILHAGTTLGTPAVAGFFAISGYLITESWTRQPSWPLYIRNRWRRIGPGFLVASAIALFVVGPIGAEDAAVYLSRIDWPMTFARAALFFEPSAPATFVRLHFHDVDGSMWTLKWEVVCYLLAPFIARRRPLLILGWCIALATSVGVNDRWAHPLLAFLTGALYRDLSLRPSWRFAAASTIIFAACLYLPGLGGAGSAVAGGAALLSFGLRRCPVRIPDISYGVYVYAWPIQMLLIRLGVADPVVMGAAAALLSLAAGAASMAVVEKPARRMLGGDFSSAVAVARQQEAQA